MSISALPAAAHQPQDTAPPAGPPWSEAHAQLLLRQVAAGDTTAFEQLYYHYAPRLAAFLRRHFGATALVDDVVNEVLFVVWQRAAVFPATACISAWLCGIACNKARRARRQWPQQAPEVSAPREGRATRPHPSSSAGRGNSIASSPRLWSAAAGATHGRGADLLPPLLHPRDRPAPGGGQGHGAQSPTPGAAAPGPQPGPAGPGAAGTAVRRWLQEAVCDRRPAAPAGR